MESDAISELVSELNRIVGHWAGVEELLGHMGKPPSSISELDTEPSISDFKAFSLSSVFS